VTMNTSIEMSLIKVIELCGGTVPVGIGYASKLRINRADGIIEGDDRNIDIALFI
jgi:hypothetical protein